MATMRHSTRAFASAPVRHVETSTEEPDVVEEDVGEEIRLVKSIPVKYEKPTISRTARNEPPPAPAALRPIPDVLTREGSK